MPVITKIRCSYASRYKATRAPTCGCRTCAEIWEAKAMTPERIAAAHRAMDDHAKGMLVRTPFDHINPGMPPALRVSP